MPVLYAVTHVFRSWKLFLALLIGITLASTFFAGIDIKANVTAKQALEQDLSHVYVDMVAGLSDKCPEDILNASRDVAGLSGVAGAEVISAFGGLRGFAVNGTFSGFTTIVGIQNHSRVYDGWLDRPEEIGENETYVLKDSGLAQRFAVGDIIPINISIYTSGGSPVFVSLNLTVKGFPQLDDKSKAIALGDYSLPYYQVVVVNQPFYGQTLIVDWEKTMQRLIETQWNLNPSGGSIGTSLLIYLDRNALISPWDIDTSINNIRALQAQIQTRTSAGYSFQNNVEMVVSSFRSKSLVIEFTFTLLSIPIFFMAWYMGTTVSDVSFSLRRREIGLLSTKGFSGGQIRRIFLIETIMLGLLGGSLGVLAGFLLNPIFSQFSTEMLFNPAVISPYTLFSTIIFGVIIALLSTYSSAKRASRLSTVDALREYLPAQETKSYKKRWPWVAFILGTYKLIIFVFGVNVTVLLTRISMAGQNFIFAIFIMLAIGIDYVLTYVGPLLFFWGSTKLFIQGSLKFQELTTRAARFLGDLGALATKNVRRNPARSAAIAFLIALIISYGAQVTIQLASQQDFTTRTIYTQVGADLSVYVNTPSDVTNVSSMILTNVSASVENSTIEYSLSSTSTGANYIAVNMKAVQPESWLKAAYYESDMFTGKNVEDAFQSLLTQKDAIILERSVAKLLKLNVGDSITLTIGDTSKKMIVVGYFGSEIGDEQGAFSQYWSFVSQEFYREINSSDSVYSTRILFKLKPEVNGTEVATNVRSLDLNISQVDSFAEEYTRSQSDVVTVGSLDAQRLGIVFAVLAASVGTALVSVVSMRERNREATIMSVKGLSYKQLVTMFVTENLAIVTFAVVLGISVGFIAAYGNISATNSFIATSALIKHRFILQWDAVLMLISYVALIFVSTIGPILIISRGYVTKLERMVRLR
ncbi:MAG TPA: FtsX-like permease family protein [Candidatus Eisenbacteria bacterium]|nr:FtsX-like permease family protein [Candidatus Eisenbacteria bacterium]